MKYRVSAPRLSITHVPIGNLKPNPLNPRVHSEKQIRQIARSIQVFGFNVPVLIDKKGRVAAGHGRVEAAKQLGIDAVPTIRLDHLTEAQVTAFAIADNRLTENGEWNDKLLAEQLKMLSEAELDFSVDVTGFEMGEVDVLVDGLTPAAEGELDPADALPETVAFAQVSKLGDLWILKRHHVYCANSLNESSFSTLMQGRRSTVVITDQQHEAKLRRAPVGRSQPACEKH